MLLVGFIVRTCHDALSSECQVYFVSLHDIVMLIQGCTLQMLGNKILRKCLVETSRSYRNLKKEKSEAT